MKNSNLIYTSKFNKYRVIKNVKPLSPLSSKIPEHAFVIVSVFKTIV